MVAKPPLGKSDSEPQGIAAELLQGAGGGPRVVAAVAVAVTATAALGIGGMVPAATAAHVMYLPVVAAACLLGLRGGLMAAGAGATLLGPVAGLAGAATGPWPLWLITYALAATVAARLLGMVDDRRKAVLGTQISMLRSFAVAVETEDESAEDHCERVATNARALGTALGLGQRELEELYWAGLLHDIGKVTVPREILRKPGGLTLEEYLVMRRHARLGASLLGSIETFRRVAEGVGAHHERWDGTGYPGGLQGEDIPLFGRILAVVDVFEALSSDRPYRRALSREDAMAELRRGSGSQFDPRLVELFERLYDEGRIQVASQPPVGTGQPRLGLQIPAQAPSSLG